MPYMRVSGITVPSASAEKVPALVGRELRTGKGNRDVSRRAGDREKDEWRVGTSAMTLQDANALESILVGEAHVWDLVGSWASSGGAGVRAGASVRFAFTGGPYADANMATVPSAATCDLRAKLGDRWTVLATRKDGTWGVYGFRSTGNYSKNGAIVAATTLPWLAKQSNGDVRLSGKTDAGANADLEIAQVVTIPAVLSDAMLNQATAWITRRWAASPVLEVSGDFLPRTYQLMRAEMESGAGHGGTLVPRRVLSFTLRQAEGA